MTDREPILVTGATGTTGSRLVPRLTARGFPVRAAGRRPTQQAGARPIRFDWHDPATHHRALDGAARLYLVPPVAAPDPAAVMLPFLERARTAGVRRVVLLSSSALPAGGPGVGQVHAALPDLFDEWAVLRPSWFMQNFTGSHLHARSIRTDGTILTATGTGRVAFVDADDIAAVAVHALVDEPAPPGPDLVITGPQALSYDEIAATLTAVTGRPVRHRPLTYEQQRDRLAAEIPEEFAALLARLDRAIAEGTEDRVTDTVERLTGQPPRSFRAFADQQAW
ncbi:NAD-dependent epimerase/dehydratase family protein [Streptomyces inhibens]|uniref:NAD-dependent epimerase/dehydratase family protein n=1 Tax=Streptomyces inhibens TaxID=2293571 RepID=A0A371Q7Z7_STRIH|nr:NAD-dependent epimerase/dehydratase family protein [Streptomyces inhibens]REK90828.1 NAD-dependent epimerase/dehydratase family protein [Streptomyces inhibens]